MNFKRVYVLVKPNIDKIIINSHLPLSVLLFGICLCTFPVGFDNNHVSFLNLQWGKSEEDLLRLLHELFSWFWLFAVLPYFLRGLLQPLGDSSFVSQMLWLRFTPCLSHEIALARAVWVISWGLWLGILGFLWASFTVLFHHLPLNAFLKLLLNVEGIVSHVLLSGGIVTAFTSFLPLDEYSGKRLVSNVACFIPIIVTPIYIAIRGAKYAVFFPYALPFAQVVAIDSETMLHFGMAAIVGILLLVLHTLAMFGNSVDNIIIDEK